MRAFLPTALLSLAACVLPAQTPAVGAVSGLVRGEDGVVLGDVEIMNPQTGKLARSDSLGLFLLNGLPAGKIELRFRRLSYSPVTATIDVEAEDTTAVIVTLRVVAQQLNAVIVLDTPGRLRDYSGFEGRRKQGIGHFITRAEIEARRPLQLSDMMRTIPGAALAPTSVGTASTLRFGRSLNSLKPNCAPLYWIDGIRAIGLNIDDVPPGDVEGIELYAGAAGLPPRFHQGREDVSCGTVVIWTRTPG